MPPGSDRRPSPGAHADWLAGLDGGTRRHYPAGATIAEPGDGPDRLFVLDEGRARICLSGAGRDLTLGHLHPGGVFVTHTRARVEALEPCTLVAWPVGEMLRLIARQPDLGLAAFREIGLLLAGALDLIEDLAFRPVGARLARFLLAEAARQNSATIRLADSTEALATALGTSRQTLSTLLNQLIREGLIERAGRRQLRLLRPERLADLAELSSG
ncbi:Crp/Fnr family transcriptional regulator [Rhodovulum strictum]|uniref:Helix-turn-helix domain-containing protein n=1 Tax=Rhodovulum strictum TaxID=58314 RepID=A0A844B753_9RHOB|nr:Crp/Fnr family transcriptional regulator [Rhodovulum strictum]MRH20214.1 helix-turn-helix domain-containing protein [Rhodovulum strictum]